MKINSDCPLCNKTEENIDHIFINCDVAVNVWTTIDSHCPNPLNSIVPIIDWLEYIRNNKHRW